jgi:branched-chain amino acid transport system substrate-binding protein
MGLTGSDAVRMVVQYSEYGLKDKIKLFMLGDVVDETYLPSQKEAALGIENYLHYAWALDTPENKRFTKIYREKFGYDPNNIDIVTLSYLMDNVVAGKIKENSLQIKL